MNSVHVFELSRFLLRAAINDHVSRTVLVNVLTNLFIFFVFVAVLS